ncbi:hypothetical protein [Streptomyces sp. NPDC092952]|uniref:hypothetical protein n=1 Tax=Streptomyces sp. NPDC092952 TaxID=3366018 RepID=UPI0037F81259
MSDATEEETRAVAEDEQPPQPFRVRDVFQFRRATEEKEEAEEEAPEPTLATTVPEQPTTLRIGDRAPNWWEPKVEIASECEHPNPRTCRVEGNDQPLPFWCPDCKTELHPDIPDTEPAAVTRKPTPTPAPAPAGDCEHPAPHEVRSKATGQLLAYWCADCEEQLEVPDDYDELADVTEGGDGGGVDEDGNPVPKVPVAVRRRWTMHGSGRKTYSRPVYGKTSGEGKKSGIEAWKALPQKTRHLLYNGAALGCGYYLGVPQFFTAQVAYLVGKYDSWTDFYVCVWYGVAIGILALDYHTRGWLPPFALAARIPLVSMIVGSLYYGVPAAI